MFFKNMLKAVAKDAFQEEIDSIKNAILSNSIETLKDVVLTVAGGKISFNEFAKRIIAYVDTKIEELKNNGEMSFVTGKIIFEKAQQQKEKILISYELYFIDANKKIIKSGAECELPSSQFKDEDLLELQNTEKIEYEVEE